MTLHAFTTLLAKTPPAGGAAVGETIIATAGALVITATMFTIVIGHRSGRIKFVQRVADFAERNSGIPGWASLPIAFVTGALLIAVFGMYWDISIHLDKGRDPGPLANAAHYFILAGLFGVFFGGLLSVCLPRDGNKPSPASVKFTRDWYMPLGGLLMLVSSSFALGAFPMDDVWHRIFGQDVTLWGPTHLVLIGGAGLASVGVLILLCEGVNARSPETPRPRVRWLLIRQGAAAGSLLLALSTFQAEFDFSVPQFRLLWHPILLMLAAGIALVAARILIGRGGALLAVAVFLLVRGLLSLYIGPITGHTPLHFPLYIAEALVVEGVALAMDRDRPIRLGLVAGAAVGVFGLAAEWGWSHIWFKIPWTSALVPEGIIAGFIAAVAGGAIGGFVGGSLRAPEYERKDEARWPAALAPIAVIGLFVFALQMDAGPHTTATFSLHDVKPSPKREVAGTVKLQPAGAAKDAEWLNVTAWQGGGSVVDPLKPSGNGVYKIDKPIPVYDNWKATLRLQKGRTVASVPVFLPKDEAVPVPEVPARANVTRPFVLDKKNLQREQKKDVPGFLSGAAYVIVLLIGLGLFTALGWGLARFAKLSARAGKEESTVAGVR
jgi:hypothetical protein